MALYRKYRPQNFHEVAGQNHIKITLLNELISDKLAHAYLFCGPRGTGKTTMARLLAKSANCENPEKNGEPCNKCSSCVEISAGRSLDIIEIDGASNNGVDNVRENIIESARFSPTKRKYKFYIIDEVHMLSISAFNALLKILEEPPRYVIFILATTEAHKIPATIISRCQRFDFKKVPFLEMVTRLKMISEKEGFSVEENVLEVVSRQSSGCARDAESLLEQLFSLGEKKINLETAELVLPRSLGEEMLGFVEIILHKKTAEGFEFVAGLLNNGLDPVLFLDNFVEFCRRLLVYKVTNNLTELSQDLSDQQITKILSLLENFSADYLLLIIKKCLSAKESFRQNYLPQLPLEAVLLEMTLSSVGPDRGASRPVAPSAPVSTKVETSGQNSTATLDPKKEEKAVELTEEKEIETENLKPQQPPVTVLGNDVVALWSSLMRSLEKDSYSVYMSLRMGKPVEFADGLLVIGFIFELQRQRVDKVESRQIIMDCLQKLTGKTWQIETRIQPGLTMADLLVTDKGIEKNESDTVEDLAREFGGTVVDSTSTI